MAKRPTSSPADPAAPARETGPPADPAAPVGRTAPGRAVSDLAAEPAETARYIAAMTAELSTLARAANLDLLVYFLDMARMEATGIVRGEKRRG